MSFFDFDSLSRKARTARYVLSLVALAAAAPVVLQAQQGLTQEPAPIVHGYQDTAPAAPATGMHYAYQDGQAGTPAPQQQQQPQRRYVRPNVMTSAPVQGVWARATQGSGLTTVSAQAGGTTELRIAHGKLNVIVRHPADNSQILVDLPGGQTSLVKDGFYTFNAETNTVRVAEGEAQAFPGNGEKGYKVQAAQEFVFGASAHTAEITREQAYADAIPGGNPQRSYGDGRGYGGGAGYGYAYGPYDGYEYGPAIGYGYPYYAYGWPYYGYDWGWGYPGFGFGWGWGGGYYRGGFRGGLR